MNSRLRYLLLVVALLTGLSLLVACEGEGEDEPVAPSPSPAAATTAPQTATPETPGAVGDPEDFAAFVDSIARAVVERDVTFFTDRVKGRAYTCTETDLGPEAWGIAAGICQEVGQQVEVVEHGYWRSEGFLARPPSMAIAISDYFASALAAESDGYGSGAVELYATGVARPSELGRTYNAAILTAITSVGEGADAKPTRTARGVSFEYVDGRWRIAGMLWADVLAEELLSAETAPYDDWTKY